MLTREDRTPADAPAVRQLLVTTAEACRILQVSRTKLWELDGRGLIRGVKLDNARRYVLASLEEYVAQLADVGQ